MRKEEKQVHVRIPEEVYKKLKVQCVYKDMSMQDFVAKLIAESLAEYSVSVEPRVETRGKKRRKKGSDGE